MIIVCPSCATSYDVEDARFSPNGRSVRCAACDRSWFVPAPEPVEDLVRRRDDAGEGRRDPPRRRREWPENAPDETEEEDEALFDSSHANSDLQQRARSNENRRAETPPLRRRAEPSRDSGSRRRQGRPDKIGADDDRDARARDRRRKPEPDPDRDERVFPLLRRRGKEDDQSREREFGARRRRPDIVDEPDSAPDYDARERFVDDGEDDDDIRFTPDPAEATPPRRPDKPDPGLRFADEDARPDKDRADRRTEEPIRPDRRRDDVVDADWEDLDDEDFDDAEHRDRRRGPSIRAERRRSTALTRADEFAALDPRILDEEFFNSLQVQPKELKKALRKARRRAEMRQKNRLTPMRALGWTLWIGVVAATLFGIYVYRNEIVRTWPNTAGAYAVIGIEANPYGLAIEDVRHRLAMSTAGPTIEITGKLRNQRDAPAKPPLLQAEALGPRGELLSRWTFEAEGDQVLAGEAIEFITRAPAPEGVAEVALSFAPEKGGVISVGDFLTRR